MTHLPQLIYDLGLILIAASITTLIFKKLKQPLVLGYILAGILVGPHFPITPMISDTVSISTWSEIGVIFLLFSLGLEFSFKKLAKVGAPASITGITEIILMIIIGFTTGKLMNWSTMDSIFLGAILSMSSTTIIIRAFDEIGAKSQKYASLVFGILIVEDLIAILLMVILSTISYSSEFSGTDLTMQVVKLIFFLIAWFIAGIFFIPTLLKKTRSLMTDETLLIVSLGMCLLMVILSVEAGFSAALGAFIMGSIFAETSSGERIEHIFKSVKDLFAAIFFVSVGLMIDPTIIKVYAGPVIIITIVTILGKFLTSMIGVLLSGQSLKRAVQTGMSLAQIGEFSFIIASLGLTLGTTSNFLYPITIAVSAVTTLTTPYMIKYATPLYNLLEKILPKKIIVALSKANYDTKRIVDSDWKIYIKSYLSQLIIFSVITFSIILCSQKFVIPYILNFFENKLMAKIVATSIILILILPPIWILAFKKIHKTLVARLLLKSKLNLPPLILAQVVRIILAILFIGFTFNLIFDTITAIIIISIFIIIISYLQSTRLSKFYNTVESHFIKNYNDKENVNKNEEYAPWNAYLTQYTVPYNWIHLGKTLFDLQLRERFGINIAIIERGASNIIAPSRDEQLYPNDIIWVLGMEAQFTTFEPLLLEINNIAESVDKSKVNLKKLQINPNSNLINKTISDGLNSYREEILIAGVERKDQKTLNPESDWVIAAEDIFWIIGHKDHVDKIITEHGV